MTNSYCIQCGIPHPAGQCKRNTPKHRGRFDWKKYSTYNGNLRYYWADKRRTTERHRTPQEPSQ